MTTKYSKIMATPAPQTEPLDNRQVKNNAGGYVYATSKWDRLARFLILGSDSGTYYVDSRKHTMDNLSVIYACLDEDHNRTVDQIVDVSASGRAKDNDPALLALAISSSVADVKDRGYALSKVKLVARTGTHLFHFMDFMKKFGRMGRQGKRAVANWYVEKTPEQLAYQMVKYRQRDGWSHKDVIKLSHPASDLSGTNALLRWGIGKDVASEQLPQLVLDYQKMTSFSSPVEGLTTEFQKPTVLTKSVPKEVIALIKTSKLPWEAVPTEFLGEAKVWEALLPDLPMTATLRNLGRLTSNGVLKDLSDSSAMVVDRLTNEDSLKKARVHPMSILFALKTYKAGRGFQGNLTWSPVGQIVDALETAFYKSFQYVEPTGKKFFLGLDISGSMSVPLMSSPLISCAEATAAMAMVTKRVEAQSMIKGFSDRFIDLNITSSSTLQEAMQVSNQWNYGRTDCSLPMVHALENRLDVDVFVVYTDNETYAGSIHPMEALRKYRKVMDKPDAKLVVVGMTSSGFTIADPADPNALDVVGFDTSTPQVISEFVKGLKA